MRSDRSRLFEVGSLFARLQIRDAPWPGDCNQASLQRGTEETPRESAEKSRLTAALLTEEGLETVSPFKVAGWWRVVQRTFLAAIVGVRVQKQIV